MLSKSFLTEVKTCFGCISTVVEAYMECIETRPDDVLGCVWGHLGEESGCVDCVCTVGCIFNIHSHIQICPPCLNF